MERVRKRIDMFLSDWPNVLLPVSEHVKTAHGKLFRAQLMLETAKLTNFGDVTDMAAVIELLHLATLIHDDIIDNAKMRRGIQSVQAKFGYRTAIVAGDFLISKCFEIISHSPGGNLKYFTAALRLICLGEALQHQYVNNTEINLANYKKIIAGKTAAMFALAFWLSSGSGDFVKIGFDIGMAFQIADDCLDYRETPANALKDTKSDLKQGILTAPAIFAIARDPSLKRNFHAKMAKEECASFSQRIINAGGISSAFSLAESYISRACVRLKWYHGSKNLRDMALSILRK